MFSNSTYQNPDKISKIAKIINIFLIIILISSCGFKIGDKQPAEKPISIDSSKFTCLSQIGKTVDEFFTAQLSLDQTKDFFTCLDSAFELFQKFTRGSEPNVYSSDELHRFLEEKIVLRTIDPKLISMAMNLKASVLGGDSQHITKSEFSLFKNILENLKQAAVELHPLVPDFNINSEQHKKLSFEERLAKTRKSFNEINGILVQTGRRIGFLKSKFKLTDLHELLVQLAIFSFGQGSEYEKANKWGEFIIALKPVIVGGDLNYIENDKWIDFIRLGVNWIGFYSRVKISIERKNFLDDFGLEDFVENIGEAFYFLNQSIKFQSSKMISIDLINNLLPHIKKFSWLPDRLSIESMTDIFNALFTKVLMDEVPSTKNVEVGLGHLQLSQLSSEFYRWSDIQFYINAHRKELDSIKSNVGSEKVYLRHNQNQSNGLQSEYQSMLRKSLAGQEVEDFIKNFRPMFKIGSSKVHLDYLENLFPSGVFAGYHHLTILNFMRSLVRLLIRGYVKDEARRSKFIGITPQELSVFYHELQSLGRDLYLIDPRNVPTLGDRSFMEGNLFTFSGNGNLMGLDTNESDLPLNEIKNRILDFNEAVELASLVYSGGQLNGELYNLGLKNCKDDDGPLDVFGRKKLNRKCVKNLLVNHLDEYIEHMPLLKNYWNGLTEKEKNEYIDDLQRLAVRPVSKESDYIELESTLEGTRPLKICKYPSFFQLQRWGSDYHVTYEKCLKQNDERLGRINKITARLKNLKADPVSCPWYSSKDISKNYCDWIESGELGTLSVLLHYMEVVIVRFDLNRDGVIDTEEGKKSFQHFKGVLMHFSKKLGAKLNDSLLEVVFQNFLITKGKIPSSKPKGESIDYNSKTIEYVANSLDYLIGVYDKTEKFVVIYYENATSEISVGRKDLIQIFNTIMSGGGAELNIYEEQRKYFRDLEVINQQKNVSEEPVFGP